MDSQQLTVFQQTIEELKRAAREDYERRIEKLDAALAVAEKLAQRAQRTDTEESVSEILARQGLTWQDPLEDNSSKPFVLKDEVRRAVRSWRGHAFRQRDITAIVQGRYPNVRVHAGSVSAALKKMVTGGEIEVVRESRGGSEPTIYREVAVSP
jgi:hypothetical protein